MDKSELLDRLGAQGEERLLLAHVLDRAEQARRRNAPAETDFLSPAEQAKCAKALRLAGFSETDWAADGGYDGAERRMDPPGSPGGPSGPGGGPGEDRRHPGGGGEHGRAGARERGGFPS